MTRAPIAGLDLLRILAALLVMLFHLAYLGWASLVTPPPWEPALPLLAPLSWFGWVGIYIFFVLSGFVIVYSAGSSSFAFFRSRFLRLVPGAWICASITAVVLLWTRLFTGAEIAWKYAGSILFSPVGPWIDDVYWTLPVEIAFYALIWLLLALRRFDRFPLVLTIVGLASAAYWAASLVLDNPLGRVPWQLLRISLLPYGCLFAIGGLLYQCIYRGAHWRHWLTIALCCAAGAICIGQDVARQGAALPPAAPILLWIACVAGVVAAVRFDSAIGGRINARAVRALGRATYPLYLLHFMIGAAATNVLTSAGIAIPGALAIVAAALVILSLLVSEVLEPPLRRQLDRLVAMFGSAPAPAETQGGPKHRCSGPPPRWRFRPLRRAPLL